MSSYRGGGDHTGSRQNPGQGRQVDNSVPYQQAYGHEQPAQLQDPVYYPAPAPVPYDPHTPGLGNYASTPTYPAPNPNWGSSQPGYGPTAYNTNQSYGLQQPIYESQPYGNQQSAYSQPAQPTYQSYQHSEPAYAHDSRPASGHDSNLTLRPHDNSQTMDGGDDINSRSVEETSGSQSSSGNLQDSTKATEVVPGNANPTQSQLQTAWGYGIRRADGSITRLWPADELLDKDLNTIAIHDGPQGLIILPEPELKDPATHAGPEQMVPNWIVNDLPRNRAMARGGYGGAAPRGGYGGNYGGHSSRGSFNRPHDAMQQQIDAIVAAAPPAPLRREKVYCDMWVHKGTCAFTQMGCKYKHVMPMDRETQMYMGLSDGIPSWYRHKYGLNMSGQPITSSFGGGAPALPGPSARQYSTLPAPHSSLPAPPSSGFSNRGGFGAGSWRRPAGAIAAEPYMSPSPLSTPATMRGGNGGNGSNASYGPVGQRSAFSRNPFNVLDSFKTEDEEDGRLTEEFLGRSRRSTSAGKQAGKGKGKENGNGNSGGPSGSGSASGN